MFTSIIIRFSLVVMGSSIFYGAILTFLETMQYEDCMASAIGVFLSSLLLIISLWLLFFAAHRETVKWVKEI